jgi:hypothetical protein
MNTTKTKKREMLRTVTLENHQKVQLNSANGVFGSFLPLHNRYNRYGNHLIINKLASYNRYTFLLRFRYADLLRLL